MLSVMCSHTDLHSVLRKCAVSKRKAVKGSQMLKYYNGEFCLSGKIEGLCSLLSSASDGLIVGGN